MNKTACVVTLGCKANQFESAAMEQQLVNHGYHLCPLEQGAHLVVINTCTVTAATDTQSRKLIRRARRINSECQIIVTGCYAQIAPQALSSFPGVTLVLGNMEKQNFGHFLQHLSDHSKTIHVSDIANASACPNLQISTFADHSRAFVQIQSGCDAFCSYCIIPFTRGRSRSVTCDSIVNQIEKLVHNGYSEVVLTGIHIGNYGRDFSPKSSLAQLVVAILERSNLHRLRLGSIEPLELTDELIAVIADNKRVCPHVHIPLQSGCDTVLQRMNRHYNCGQFRNCIEKLHSARKNMAIGMDVISGFPGESEAEHMKTIEFVESLPISSLHVFPFSKRTGTVAAEMKDQVPAAIAKERAKQLRLIGEQKHQRYMEQFVGKYLEVVMEKKHANNNWKGISGEYLPVTLFSEDDISGQCLIVHIESMATDGLSLLATRTI